MKCFKGLMAVFLLFLFAVPPAFADDAVAELKAMMEKMQEDYQAQMSAMETRLKELEAKQEAQVEKKVDQRVAQLSEEIRKEVEEKTLDVEYVGRGNGPVGRGGLVVENPFGFGNVTLGGYFDHEFEDFENTKSTFDQHRWIINIGAQLTDRIRFNSEYEIEHGGPDAPGGEAKVEIAEVDYLINDMINVRGGILLAPFGRYNLYHDSDLQDLTDRPLVMRDVIPTTWSEAGAGFFGEFNPVFGEYEDMIVQYEAYVVNGLDDGFSDRGLGGAKPSFSSDNNNNKGLVGRVNVSPWLGHEAAVSGYTGKYNTMGDAINGVAFDTFHTFGPLELIGEFAYFDIDEPAGSNVTNEAQGGYIQANYHFWPEFFNDTFLGRGFDNPTLTLVGRWGWAELEDDDSDPAGDNKEERFTIGLNYRPVESFVWKLEYQFNDTDNESLERGSNDGFITSVAMGF